MDESAIDPLPCALLAVYGFFFEHKRHLKRQVANAALNEPEV